MKLLPHQKKRCMDCEMPWFLCGRNKGKESQTACSMFIPFKQENCPISTYPDLKDILKYMD